MAFLMRFANSTAHYFTLYRNSCQGKNQGVDGYQCQSLMEICKRFGIFQDKVAKKIYVNKSSVTRQLALLEQSGFIRREPYLKDRRRMMSFPTEKTVAWYPLTLDMGNTWGGGIMKGFTKKEKKRMCLMKRAAAKVEKPIFETEGGSAL